MINVGQHFVNALMKEADEIIKIMNKVVPMEITKKQEKSFKIAQDCHICGIRLGKDRVRDHDHLTGEYRGAAHNHCNLEYGWKRDKNGNVIYQIPVIFHNLRGYDSHLIIKSLTKKVKQVKCIPSSTEKFITFSINNLQFIDSLSFIQASLEQLVESLSQTKALHSVQDVSSFNDLTQEQIDLLSHKGLYPNYPLCIIKHMLSQQAVTN